MARAFDKTAFASAAMLIGGTPAVELTRFCSAAGVQGRIVAKLELLNPGFSKKDRVAAQMIEDAESAGLLHPGQSVIELTSGNTGTGLAIVCACKGYRFIAVMSRGNSTERARMMAALGAEVVLVDQAAGSLPGQVSGEDLARVEQVTRQLTTERGAFRADQFRLPANFRAHYLGTGPELYTQSGGELTAFCDFVGSGGTFGGCAAALKQRNSAIRCYIVEPDGAAVLAGKAVTRPGHRVQGGGYAMTELPNLHLELADGFVQVTDGDAAEAARLVARSEGLFAGFSGGANLAAAVQLLRGDHANGTIGLTLNDSGLKYLSTDLFP